LLAPNCDRGEFQRHHEGGGEIERNVVPGRGPSW